MGIARWIAAPHLFRFLSLAKGDLSGIAPMFTEEGAICTLPVVGNIADKGETPNYPTHVSDIFSKTIFTISARKSSLSPRGISSLSDTIPK